MNDARVQQRDAADEGRLEPSGSIIVGRIIVNQGEVAYTAALAALKGRNDLG